MSYVSMTFIIEYHEYDVTTTMMYDGETVCRYVESSLGLSVW